MSRGEVRAVRSMADDTSLHIEADIFFPEIYMESLYKGAGKFNSFKVKSKGYVNVTWSKYMRRATIDCHWTIIFPAAVAVTWKMDGFVERRNGEDYMKIKGFDMIPKIQNMKVSATGLFPDPDVNQFAVEFLNQYWELLYKQFYPATRGVWEPVILNTVNKIFDRVPYRRLLPKNWKW